MANSSQPSPEVAKYFELKKQLLQLEQSIAKPYYDSFGPRSLPFNVENYYAVGSPLGCFLALRGIKPSQNGSIENLLPKNAAKRFYNLFHPYDPVVSYWANLGFFEGGILFFCSKFLSTFF